jgi:hypothetical protein
MDYPALNYLYVRFAKETDEHVYEDGHYVEHEAGPVIDLERSHEGSYQHEEDVSWSQDGTSHHQSLRGKHNNITSAGLAINDSEPKYMETYVTEDSKTST